MDSYLQNIEGLFFMGLLIIFRNWMLEIRKAKLTLKRQEMFLKIFHVFICLLKYKNLNNEYALDIVKG
jgi:hypothetical protein